MQHHAFIYPKLVSKYSKMLTIARMRHDIADDSGFHGVDNYLISSFTALL